MGDVVDAILEGTLCEVCGVYLEDAEGYPRKCWSCEVGSRPAPAPKTLCPVCSKRVKVAGLKDHLRDSHKL